MLNERADSIHDRALALYAGVDSGRRARDNRNTTMTESLTALADRLESLGKGYRQAYLSADLQAELIKAATYLREMNALDSRIEDVFARLFPTWAYSGSVQAVQVIEQHIAALRQHAERGGWVPVSERLPENDDPVWAYYHPVIDGHVFPQVRKLCYSSERNTWLIDGWDGDYNTPIEPEDRVTHWQVIVLPTPPTTKEVSS